ncbi:MAG: rhomboid family intramembrane serine protease [Saprospiraceae bacterium]|nr:MAG: rhomboid family protein [Bacteroidetes bacterium OLB9]MCO6462618.1 rhomboid family intramembrane serine protease [Saprospiraceae bacterium]MCZ2337583.1 rhomboid family intramembrane serine protease [Chitinophagales bacterium]
MNVTLIIVIITCLISIACFNNRLLFDQLKHYPAVEAQRGQYYRWITSGFVHGDLIHLFVNMFVMYSFGHYIEQYLVAHFGSPVGQILYVFSYLLIIVMADISTFYKHRNNPYFSSVGASGGVSGILIMYIMINPWSMLGLYMIIPVPAIIFGVMYLWYSTWAAKNQAGIIDHDAHFFGAVAGALILIIIRPVAVVEFVQRLVQEFPL